jgi:hypothetical protein
METMKVLCPNLLLSLFLFLFIAPSVGVTAEPDFAEGQEWSIKSSPPSTAKIVIGRIESWKNKIAVHVSIIDIPLSFSAPNPNGLTKIDHMPFEKSALAASVDRLLSTGVAPPPNFETGYIQWKEHKGGIFTISVMQAINLGHEMVNPRTQ